MNAMLPLLAAVESDWSDQVIAWAITVGVITIVIGMLLCTWRVIRGPHMADRAVAADAMAIQLIGLVVLLSMRMKTVMYFDSMLLLSLLGFAGAVAMGQYIARRKNAPPTHRRRS